MSHLYLLKTGEKKDYWRLYNVLNYATEFTTNYECYTSTYLCSGRITWESRFMNLHWHFGLLLLVHNWCFNSCRLVLWPLAVHNWSQSFSNRNLYGSWLKKTVTITTATLDIGQFPSVNQVYDAWRSDPHPLSTIVREWKYRLDIYIQYFFVLLDFSFARSTETKDSQQHISLTSEKYFCVPQTWYFLIFRQLHISLFSKN